MAALEKAAEELDRTGATPGTPGTPLNNEALRTLKTLRDAREQIANGVLPADAFGVATFRLSPEGVGDSKATTAVERAAIIRGAQQCWLLYNSPAFAKWRMKNTPTNPDGNIKIPGYTSPNLSPGTQGATAAAGQRIILTSPATVGYALQNKLNYRPGTKEFTTIQTHEYAQTSPLLRIYKVRRDMRDRTRKALNMVEMQFTNHTTLDGIAKELESNRINGNVEKFHTRGSEVGVKSFEWQFLGTDPYTATRDISATLKLHAQSMAVLTKIRKGPVTYFGPALGPLLTDENYRYIDLLVQPNCPEDYSPDCFEVRVDVGYSPLNGPTAAVRDGIKRALECQKDILYLVLVDHTFEIAEDGSIDVTINFKGRLETLMKTRKTNVLLPYGGDLQDAIKFDVSGVEYTPAQAEEEIARLKALPNYGEQEKKQVKALETALSDLSFKYKQVIHAHILDTLNSKNLIYEFDLGKLTGPDAASFELFKLFQARLSSAAALPSMVAETQISSQLDSNARGEAGAEKVYATQEQAEDAEENAAEELLALSSEERRKVKFFYFGDLIAIVLQSVTGDNTATGNLIKSGFWKRLFGNLGEIEKNSTNSAQPNIQMQELFRNFRVIFGNIEIDSGLNPNINEKTRINLAHMPISLESYSAFYRSNILSSNTAEYPFFDFVDDLLAELVIDPISSACFGGLFDLSFRPKTSTLIAATGIGDDIYDKASTGEGSDALDYNALNLDKIRGKPVFDYCIDSSDISQLNEYFVIGAEVQDLDMLKGCEIPDGNIGISHLHFGNAFGLMKKVTFQKSDIEYLPEMRYAAEGNFLYNQLANVYDCNIDLLGTNLYKPGQYVYINTRALGAGETWDRNPATNDRSWANLMGLGGYHLVTEAAHSISRDGFHTNLKCRWIASGKREVGEGCEEN